MKCWLGIDCGSVSLKFALINENNELMESLYYKNKGITETVKEGLRELADSDYEVCGVGCTGSGRHFLKLLVGGT